MTKKLLPAFIILVLLGQAFIWLTEQHLEVSFVLRAGLVVLLIKLFGDLLGRFVFKWPGHKWIYLRDYVQTNLLPTFGFYALFAIVWVVVLVLLDPSIAVADHNVQYPLPPQWVHQIISSSLLPALYYLSFQLGSTEVSDKTKKRMRTKL